MTVIDNHIDIQADRAAVWKVLADLEALAIYDPVVSSSVAITDQRAGIGAKRTCQTRQGWFEEEVTEWEPDERLTFALYRCNLPMKDLTHTYVLEDLGGATRVRQVMRYRMKLGVLGALMDALIGRRQADKGIKQFMAGLKRYVETGRAKGD